MVSVSATVLEAAKIGVVHQTDVAHLGAFDNDDIVLVEVLALVDKFQGVPPEGHFSPVKTEGEANNGAQFISTTG
jgi:hypothetical protein